MHMEKAYGCFKIFWHIETEKALSQAAIGLFQHLIWYCRYYLFFNWRQAGVTNASVSYQWPISVMTLRIAPYAYSERPDLVFFITMISTTIDTMAAGVRYEALVLHSLSITLTSLCCSFRS